MERQIETRLKENEVRFTRGRRTIVEALGRSDGPRSAGDLADEPNIDVPLSSIYRSLVVLESAGVVVPHYSSKGITRYELSEWISGHHHHLLCVHCGQVEDIDVTPDVEVKLEKIVDQVGSDTGFVAQNHALEIEGTCSRCQ